MATRNKYPKSLSDPRAVLALQKRTHVQMPENYFALSWEQIHELRSKLQKGNESILQIAEKESRDLNEEETLAFNTGMEFIDSLQEELNIRSAAGTKNPVDTSLDGQRLPAGLLNNSGDKKHNGPAAKKDYRNLFGASGDMGGFTSLDDFLNSLTNRLKDERMDRRTFLAKDGPSGGYSVPEYWTASIFDTGLESEIVRPRATVYPMDSEMLHIPAWDSMNHTNGTMFGGFTISYLGENQDATPVTGKLRQITLTSHKVGIYTEISREAQTSGVSLETQLRTKLTQAVSFLLDRDFLTGNGISKPLGVLNSPSKITVARATASQVNYQDVYTLYGRLAPECQANAVWVASHSVLPQLMNMQVGNELIFNPITTGGIAGPVPMSLFGKPLLFTEKVPALGTEGDLMLVDFSQYALGLRQEVVLDISNAPGWTRDVISLRCIVRIDGSSLWQSAITPLNGSDTLSWCVVLQ